MLSRLPLAATQLPDSPSVSAACLSHTVRAGEQCKQVLVVEFAVGKTGTGCDACEAVDDLKLVIPRHARGRVLVLS